MKSDLTVSLIRISSSSMYFRSIDKLNDFDQNRATFGSSIKSQVLDLPIFSPLKRDIIAIKVCFKSFVT